MITNKKHFRLSELENLFAEDFSSPIFPILAEFYLNNSQIDKALKVLEIGLKNSPDNFTGQYVLSKIYIMNDNFIKSEKLLRNIVKHQPCNTGAFVTLIKIKILLKRSKNTIEKYINEAFDINSCNPEIKSLYQKYYHKGKTKNKISTTNKKLHKENTTSIKFDNRLATKSMYNVFINQKKYNEAIQILERMSKKKQNKTFVSAEKAKILKLKKGKKNDI